MSKKKHAYTYFDRELSWLAFNARVLQEAEDPSVPLGARLDFLAIFSSNLDEFFRVRVASLRSLLRPGSKSVGKLDTEPAELLRAIHGVVDAQQSRFGEILRTTVMPELKRQGIHLIDERALTDAQAAFVEREFETRIRPYVTPVMLDVGDPPFLVNRGLYLVVELEPANGVSLAPAPARYALVEVPASALGRFIVLPADDGDRYVMFLDDAIRVGLPTLFPDWSVVGCSAIKLTRDAELYLEDEFSGDLANAIRRSLSRRESGLPSRFLYDGHAPHGMIEFLQARFGLEPEDMVPGGRYHNLHDLARFPRFGMPELCESPPPPLPHVELDREPSLLDATAARDRLLHPPYHSFEPVIRFLEEAAADPYVEEVWITLYRAARDSAVVDALVDAAARGKQVTAFVEVKARFDEESNLDYGERLRAAGVRTIFGMPGVKVHAKLALVVRSVNGRRQSLAYLSTGNFNERTARVYADHGLFTADPRLTGDVREVFAFLSGEKEQPECSYLLVAPFTLRKSIERLIQDEIDAAAAGQPAGMVLKMNSLEDHDMIARLYEASRAGVPIDLIVRGICCLVPGARGQSETIRVRSIVDRFLEHARILIFHQRGRNLCYLASADFMSRNLNRRVEVAFPILDRALHSELGEVLRLQLADNIKAREIDRNQNNRYIRGGDVPVRAQFDFHRLLQARLQEDWSARSDSEDSGRPTAVRPLGRMHGPDR